MKPEKLVEILNREAVEGNLALYKELLDTTTDAQDPVWKGILPIYINLSKDERESFIKFLRIVEINTLSHVLGILDGSTYAEGIDDEFILTTEKSNEKINEKINEDLQSLFLEHIEGQ